MSDLPTRLHACGLRLGAGLAFAFAGFLVAYPVGLYLEGHWIQDLVGLACFLVVSGILATGLLLAARRGWGQANRL